MSLINRRNFLRGTAGALGAIALNQLQFERSATRYGKALAQSTPRKVALLIGINGYTGSRLEGPANDIELQRQLLIHRFGFSDSNVHRLTDAEATRQNILDAFNEYLYGPAQAGDVIVLHFSGHGERVRESDLMRSFLDKLERNCVDIDKGECFNTAIAPYRHDADVANGVQDIMGHTLLLMRAALAKKTENVTFVLDCCYAGGGKRGSAVMRSLNQASLQRADVPQISDTEWEYQQYLMAELGWDEQQFADAITSERGPGFFVGSAKYDQLAADYSFDGFVAGAFTYLLTHYLWQATSPLSETISMVTSSSTRLAEHTQQPIYDPHADAERAVSQKPIYHIEPVAAHPAEALVLDSSNSKAGGDSLRLWLGGLDPWTLEAFDQGAIFSVIDKGSGDELGEIRQVDGTRRELIAEGQWVSNPRNLSSTDVTGQFLQEKVRGIPKTVTLKVGLLAETLTPEEQQIVQQQLGSSDFEVFPIEPGKVAHILIGRYDEATDQHLAGIPGRSEVRQAIGSIGLFSPTQEPVLVGSFGPPGETMEAAIARLRSRFISLYLGRMLALMVNQQTSQIDVSVEVEHLGSLTGTTTRSGNADAIILPRQSERGIEAIPVGEVVAVKVQNNEDQDLHFGILVIDAAGEVNVLFPPVGVDDSQIDVIPRRGSQVEGLRSARPYGITELLVLASPQSLVGPLKKLRNNAPDFDRSLQRGAEADSVEAMNDIFGAMDTRRSGESSSSIQGPRLLDVDEVAVLSLLFEITPSAE
jgi:hypothetical protein